MKPFPAWLAMDKDDEPARFGTSDDEWFRAGRSARGAPTRIEAFSRRKDAREYSPSNDPPLRVLIVADTPENRKKLGMEAECRS